MAAIILKLLKSANGFLLGTKLQVKILTKAMLVAVVIIKLSEMMDMAIIR